MTNRDILKEAIADAKAVKETAIANAKVALEEAFTPFLKKNLAAKLAEIDEMDEKITEESDEMKDDMDKDMYENMDEDMYEEKNSIDDEINLDELLSELEDLEKETLDEEGFGKFSTSGEEGFGSMGEKALDESEEEAEDETEEEFDIEDMSEEDLKSFIEDIISDMVEAGELEAGHEGMEDEVEDEEVNLDELLREMSDKNNFRDAITLAKAVVGEYGQELKSSEKLDERKALGYASKMMREAGMEPVTIKNLLNGFADEDWPSDYVTEVSRLLRDKIDYDDLDRSNDNAYEEAFSSMDEAKKMKKEKDEMKKELDEAYKALAKVKSELNEINLLNSKLLYSNKVFKAKNLTESQKVKVLSAFDKATSKKEAQLVYETVMENLTTQTTQKRPVTESVRGIASKVIAGAQNTKQPIIEANSAFERMQKLAGIKK
jgi:hypothetical protein